MFYAPFRAVSLRFAPFRETESVSVFTHTRFDNNSSVYLNTPSLERRTSLQKEKEGEEHKSTLKYLVRLGARASVDTCRTTHGVIA